MKSEILSKLAAIAVTLSMLTGCSSADGSASSNDTVSSNEVTAAPQVTLPSSSEVIPEESGSEADSSQGTESDPVEVAPAMWELTAPNGTKITFMGSMHALKDETYPLPDSIMSAYENADVLAVECDITSITTNFSVQLLQYNNLYYDKGETIEDHLDPEVFQGVCDFIEACGGKPEVFVNFRPWALSSQLEALAIMLTDLDTSKGIDMYLLDMAHEDGKEIYEVESVEFQTEMLINDIPDETYLAMMESYTADYKDIAAQELEDTYQAWISGDVDFFAAGNDLEAAIAKAEEEGETVTAEERAMLEEYFDLMIFDRNIGMAEKVMELMEGDKDVFYVVGAAHFAGDGGIIDLLEKEGIEVTRIQ